jgi:hypothetical protein
MSHIEPINLASHAQDGLIADRNGKHAKGGYSQQQYAKLCYPATPALLFRMQSSSLSQKLAVSLNVANCCRTLIWWWWRSAIQQRRA